MNKGLKGLYDAEAEVITGLAKQGISVTPLRLSSEETLKSSDDTFVMDKDVLRRLAIDLSHVVTWRGLMEAGKFDEHYHTPEYHLYSDEWEMFHIRVIRKKDNKVILSAMTRENWNGTEQDYHALVQLIQNHKEILPLLKQDMSKNPFATEAPKVQDVMEANPAPSPVKEDEAKTSLFKRALNFITGIVKGDD